MATAAAPRLTYSEFRLAGSWILKAYTSRQALLTNADRQRGRASLFLLDLSSGLTRSLVATMVAPERDLVLGGAAFSDGVVAWEEVSPQDADRPEQTVWRLYACEYDASRGLVGSPILLDRADDGSRSRPLFAVDERTVAWLSNTRHRTGRWSGCVKRFDLTARRQMTVLDASTPFDTLSLSEHRLLVTRETAEGGEELLALTPGDPKPVVTPLSGTGKPSHFPALHDGVTAWAVFKDEKPWPDLYLRGSAGERMLGRDALDPVFAGDYLFYESNEESDSPRDKSHYASIWGIRSGTSRKFRLILTEVATEGWWQTAMAQGYLDDVFVVANDMSPWNDGRDPHTLVRVYRL